MNITTSDITQVIMGPLRAMATATIPD
jgi:hypothetical protein